MKSNGFSLIEVMVTLVLTTIGILGMVAMQGRSIQYSQDAVHRNAAVMLTGDLLEIIRTNPTEILQKAPPSTAASRTHRFSTRQPVATSPRHRPTARATPRRLRKCAIAGSPAPRQPCPAPPTCSKMRSIYVAARLQGAAMATAPCWKSNWHGL